MELYGVFSGPEMHYTYPNGDDVSNVDIVFICRDYEGALKPQVEECSELLFFRYDEVPLNISPPIRTVIAKWINSHKA